MSVTEHDHPMGRADHLDMSVVSDIEVARALRALLKQWRMRKRWDAFAPDARRLHRQILQSYLETGAPPLLHDLDSTLLQDLIRRDLVVSGVSGISAAYPFSTSKTRHRVVIGGQQAFAVCAIDALGAGAMAGRASRVESSCPTCVSPIRIEIAGNGLDIASGTPDSACVWAGVVPVDGCAADTQCRAMLLFCSEAHRLEWQEDQSPAPEGFALSLQQAVQTGAAIFRPFLDR